MASEDVVGKSTEGTAVTTIVNLAEEAKLAREEIKAPSHALLSICKPLIAGGVAGGVSRTAVAPLERLKILLQVQNPHNIKYNGTLQGLKYIWNTEGFRGLFKGNGANCARIVPNSAVKFFSYEQASRGILFLYKRFSGNEDAELMPVLRLGAGACAGIIAMSAVYPMDMVRGRITVQTEASPYQYRGISHALSTVYREEGIRALYKGWLPSIIGVPLSRAAASCSISMADDSELAEFLDYMEKLKNYERSGVPKGAGTDTDDGFDLGRMRRLLRLLGDPHRRFKVVHIAGTKGKGSTAAFLCNILREEGYLVGSYTSPHLFSIRERICVGSTGDPVPASTLKSVFDGVKGIIDQSIEQESGALSHFEVFTALAFLLFSEEKVDIAVIEAGLGGARDATNVICDSELLASVITSIGKEHLAALGGSLESIAIAKSGIIKQSCPVVIGGPFEPHIDRIIRDKASSMNSPVISACDPGIQKFLKSFVMEEDGPLQICDIFIQGQDLQLQMDLSNVKLHMLGMNQLQNAVTAACTALCLQNQGWKISEKSICKGLEQTKLLGRSQFLTQKEIRGIGLSRTKILIDGAHTEASAKGLAEVVRMTHPGVLAFVVAMANDKDHVGFARQLLSGPIPELVILTEASIAGGKSRITSTSTLKDAWVRAAAVSQTKFLDVGMIDSEKTLKSCDISSPTLSNDRPLLLASSQMESIVDLIKIADQLLESRVPDQPRLIVVTGSLHVVSSVLASVQL